MRYIFLFLLLASTEAFAQCKEFTLTAKGDTLNCVDMQGKKQGPWIVRVESLRGERGYEEEGFYHNGIKEGPWRRYSLEGDVLAVENYRWGQKHGKNVYFDNMGQLLREESWRAVDPQNPYDTVNVYDVNDPSKIIRKQIVKIEPRSFKHGMWVYYDPHRGVVERRDAFLMDRPARQEGDDLVPLDVLGKENTTVAKEEKKPVAKPKEVLEFEKKNAGKKKIKVKDGSTGG